MTWDEFNANWRAFDAANGMDTSDQEIKDAYGNFDKDYNGFLSKKEFKQFYNEAKKMLKGGDKGGRGGRGDRNI